MHETDHRSEADYRPFPRAFRRRMRACMDSCEAIDAAIRSPRFRATVRLGCIACAMKDVERREGRQRCAVRR